MSIPFGQRRPGDNRQRMAVRVVAMMINMRPMRLFFLLHVAEKRSPASHVDKLIAAANAEERDSPLQRLFDQAHLDAILQRVRLFQITKILTLGAVVPGM